MPYEPRRSHVFDAPETRAQAVAGAVLEVLSWKPGLAVVLAASLLCSWVVVRHVVPRSDVSGFPSVAVEPLPVQPPRAAPLPSTGSGVPASTALTLAQVNDVLAQATHGHAQAFAVFPGPAGLTGALVGAPGSTGTQRVIAWIDHAGDVMVGSLLDKDGDNLTLGAIQAFSSRGVAVGQQGAQGPQVSAPTLGQQAAKIAAYEAAPTSPSAEVDGLHRVTPPPQGLAAVSVSARSGAPVLDVFFDPDCVYCHVLWQNLADPSVAGKIAVRWIPVAVVHGADSVGRAASIVSGGMAAFQSNEAHFDGGSETGGAPISYDRRAVDQVVANTKAYIQWSRANGLSGGTPTLAWRTKNGDWAGVVGAQTADFLRGNLIGGSK